jgi:hypothetical protein
MARTRLISINGNGGAWTSVYATQVTRRAEIIEDFSANSGVGQGLQYQFDDDQTPNFTTVYEIAPQSEPIILGTPIPQGAGYARVLGNGPDNSGGYSIPATLLVNLRSASALGTTVRVTEFD